MQRIDTPRPDVIRSEGRRTPQGGQLRVDFFRHGLEPQDAEAVASVLSTVFLTSGPIGKQVEAQIARLLNVEHCLLVNSWTNGALATLLALGVGPGDEVIVPAMTFVATANVVELLGARPVFVDVDPDTLLMDIDQAARAVTGRTKAVVPVHLYGQMVDMDALKEALSHQHHIAIIEDAAHCFEGSRDGYRPGQRSDAAVFSFYATKNVTCGEGGAVVTGRADLAEAVRKTRLHGMSAAAADRFSSGQYRHWDMEVLGVKANLPDVLAALLPKQLDTVLDRLPRRQMVAERYRKAFADSEVGAPRQIPGCVSAEHLFPVRVDPKKRDPLLAALGEAQIGATVNYRPVPTLTYYREKYGYRPDDFPVSWAWGQSTLTLPLYPSLTEEQQDHVVRTLLDRIRSL
jgi:UDP-4-amino-4-deoxy-L-arabinose-oxoglutarate aminotransferase